MYGFLNNFDILFFPPILPSLFISLFITPVIRDDQIFQTSELYLTFHVPSDRHPG